MSKKTKNVLHAWKEYKELTPAEWSASLHCYEEVYDCPNGDTITFYFEIGNDTPVDYVRTINEQKS